MAKLWDYESYSLSDKTNSKNIGLKVETDTETEFK